MSSSSVDYPGRVDRPERRHIVAFCNLIRDHVGKDKAITAAKLEALMGVDDAHDTSPRIREVVRYCRRELRMPIGSGTTGYYLIAKPEELIENLQHFEDRIAGYNRSKNAILAAVNENGFADATADYAGVVDVAEVVADGE